MPLNKPTAAIQADATVETDTMFYFSHFKQLKLPLPLLQPVFPTSLSVNEILGCGHPNVSSPAPLAKMVTTI